MEMNIPPDRLQNKIAFEFLKKYIWEGKIKKILDIGSADNVLERFMPGGVKYYSHDIGNYGVKHDFNIDLDKEKFPIKQGFFDAIICLETLEHTMYPKRVLKEILRISKKDAVYAFSLPNDYNFMQRIYFLLEIKRKNDAPWKIVEEHHHIHKPRVKDILDLFSEDFKILKIKFNWESHASSRGRVFRIVDRIINKLSGICPNLFAREVVLLCVRKK